MKYGLDSYNFKILPNRYQKETVIIPENFQKDKIVSYLFTFTKLSDNTEYDVYFIGENDLPVNPDLQEDTLMQKDSFITHSEVYSVPWNYDT